MEVLRYAKTALKSFVGMSKSKLPTNFQLNIVIFEAKATLQTLLQSVQLVNTPKAFLYS